MAIGLAAVVAIASLSAVRTLDLRSKRDQLLRDGERRAANLAVVLTGYLRQSFVSVDASLRQLALLSPRIGGPDAPESDWGPALISARAALPVGSISVVDRAGVILHSTQKRTVGQSRRDQYVFRRLASTKTDELVADTPFRAEAGIGDFLIPLGRRLSAPGRTFDGMVVATFIPNELRDVFRSADVGRDGMVAVFHRSGVVVFREPSEENALGHAAADQPLFEAAKKLGGDGIFRGRASPNGAVLRTLFRSLPERDLIVAVSLSEGELLWEWRRDAFTAIVVILLLALALAAILVLIFREMDLRLAAAETLGRSQRMESIGRLTGGIAHDFNNLLTVILGNVTLIHDGAGTGSADGIRESAAQIERAAMRGTALIRQLLSFARRQPLQPRTFDLAHLIRDSKPMLDRVLGEDVTLELAIHADPPRLFVNIDPVGAESALLNLCINARDAMPEGGTITIELSRAAIDASYARDNPDTTPGQYVLVSVSDTGIGIPPEDMARLFEPFFTTKDVGRGTGLGLSTVYGFVKQSAGHVKVVSELGRGTSVKLYFPETAESMTEAPAVESDEEPRGNGEVILVAEDEPDLLKLASRFLEDLGYCVLRASNGAEATEVAGRKQIIDLLLTDIVMPGGISGQRLARDLRAHRPDLPVVYVSGYADDALESEDGLTPVGETVLKPYNRAQLAVAIRNALRTRAGLTADRAE